MLYLHCIFRSHCVLLCILRAALRQAWSCLAPHLRVGERASHVWVDPVGTEPPVLILCHAPASTHAPITASRTFAGGVFYAGT